MSWAMKLLRHFFPAVFWILSMLSLAALPSDVLMLDAHAMLRTLGGNNFTRCNEDEIARRMCTKIREYCVATQPRIIVFSLDGVCPLAKRPTQRSRRKDVSLSLWFQETSGVSTRAQAGFSRPPS